jgi:DNA repair protein RecO (recombination protein O)
MVQFFTQEQGRLVGVVKGLRRGRNPVQMQPFTFGSLSCYGRGSMVTVTQFDPNGHFELAGDALVAGFYVLELISRSLTEWQTEPRVFAATHTVLAELSHGSQLAQGMAPCLRRFEGELLNELGYGLDYSRISETGAAIESNGLYECVRESGFVPVEDGSRGIPGWVLLAIGQQEYSDPRVLRVAKQLNQQALEPLIGPQPIVSRSLLSGAQPPQQPQS